MTNAFLAERVRDVVPELSNSKVQKIVKNFNAGIVAALGARGEFRLTGIGTLRVVLREARKGRNPHTGVEVPIPSRYAIRFKTSDMLNDVVNKSPPPTRKVKPGAKGARSSG